MGTLADQKEHVLSASSRPSRQKIVDDVDAYISEMEHDVKTLREMRDLLRQEPRARRPSRAIGTEAPAKPRARTEDRPIDEDAILTSLRNGSQQTGDIAKEHGVSVAVIRNRLRDMENAGSVTREGERRNTVWHVVE